MRCSLGQASPLWIPAVVLVAVALFPKPVVAVELFGPGPVAFSAGLTTRTDAFAVGDMDRDGHPDVVAVDANGLVGLLRADGVGGFTTPTAMVSSGNHVTGLALADLNQDGALDLALVGHVGGWDGKTDLAVMLGDGQGGFGPAARHAVGRWECSVVAGDFDGDSAQRCC